MLKCAVCGKEFEPVGRNYVTCSKECQKIRARQIDHGRVGVIRASSKSARQAMMERLAARDREFAAWNPNAGPRKTYWKSHDTSQGLSEFISRFN